MTDPRTEGKTLLDILGDDIADAHSRLDKIAHDRRIPKPLRSELFAIVDLLYAAGHNPALSGCEH